MAGNKQSITDKQAEARINARRKLDRIFPVLRSLYNTLDVDGKEMVALAVRWWADQRLNMLDAHYTYKEVAEMSQDQAERFAKRKVPFLEKEVQDVPIDTLEWMANPNHPFKVKIRQFLRSMGIKSSVKSHQQALEFAECETA